jgi:glycerol-3-phosphate dehydrogenase
VRYLCDLASDYLAEPIGPEQVVWTYSGVRPLVDDGAQDAAKLSRDYEFALEEVAGAAPLLSVYGGKITTFRRLAEEALGRLERYFPGMGGAWTAGARLPGGDFDGDIGALLVELGNRYPRIDPLLLRTLARRHGSLVPAILGEASGEADLGPVFGGHLCAREVDWLMREEWAVSPEDVLLRRTKEWLHMDAAARARLGQAMAAGGGGLVD